jgi:7,8-dihydropterin-6-yl-methyl-4-(beta-D-ribofuranosyl)aminobenzene 5'-phosphate synthase
MTDLRIVYDDRSMDPMLPPSHGFACVIHGLDKTILFDTGTKGDLLLSNMETLQVDRSGLDLVFLSHNHYDHTGGLPEILGENPDLEVCVPASFPREFDRVLPGHVVRVSEPIELFPGAFSTGEIGDTPREQSLYFESQDGIVLVTGCAHPGVVEIAGRVVELTGRAIHLVLGGFHLYPVREREVRKIARDLKELGVRRVGPCHCTGDEAIGIFRETFGADFLPVHVGTEVALP